MLFTNVDAFRAVLKDYAIQKGFPLVRLKNEKSRCTAKCGAEGCNWRIHASLVADTTTFMVKTYTPEHTCVMNRKNSEATSDWIAKKLIYVMRDHPEMTSKGVKAEMQKHGVLPSRMQIYRAKNKVLEQIEGSHNEAYGKLPKYAELLRMHNPGSIMKIHYDRPNLLIEPKFLRLFISFKAQRDGFLAGCKPFIGFDGCHLKGAFGGILLIAVALDGNNSLFPLAFAVVECKNKEAWSWFFYYFQEFFGPFPTNISLTFMSDRQKGLNLAYEEQVPEAAARYCCWHIYYNFKVKFPGSLLRRFFWQATKSYDLIGHNEAMERTNNINIDAWRYLVNIPKCNWARHAFSIEIKCDHVTNNFTESFNAWVGELRGKNILALADGLRQKFMKKLHKRYQKGCTWTSSVTPHITSKLKGIAAESRRCSLTMASENTFEVADVDKSYIVKLIERTCACRAFQLTGIPCKHAALGATYRREKLKGYCDAAFSNDQYLKTYAFMINPILHMNRWPPMEDVTLAVVLPPPLRRRAGRPRRNRRRAPDEGASASQHKRSISFRCSKCGAFGHNRRTCQGAPIAEKRGSSTSTNQVSSRRGRPRRGIANTGLAGSVLWEHAQGNVPVIVSSQGSNGSTQNQTAGANVQLNHSACTSTNTRKQSSSSRMMFLDDVF
nr:uncharacterized protein LOC113693526 [Coffea arabica]